MNLFLCMSKLKLFVSPKVGQKDLRSGQVKVRKTQKKRGDLDVKFFNQKGYRTNFMPKFCRLLGFGGKSPPVPPRGAATD